MKKESKNLIHRENSSTHSWDESDLIFGKTLGVPRHVWPHPI